MKTSEGKNGKKTLRAKEGRWGALRALALTTTLGMELAISVVLGYYGGGYLDRIFGTAPWLLLAGVLGGLAAGIVSIYKTLTGFLGE